MAMSDSQQYPFALYLINNVQDIVVFLGLKVLNSGIYYLFSCSRNMQVMLVEKPQLKIICFKVINIDIEFKFDQAKILRAPF